MFRACWSQSSRSIASSSSQYSSSIHTSALLHAQASRQSVARSVKSANTLRREERWEKAQANRPSVVLGTRPGEEHKWDNCLLSKVLVDVDVLVSSTKLIPSEYDVGTVNLPRQVSFGIGETEKQLLFGDLPLLSSTRGRDHDTVPTPKLPLGSLFEDTPSYVDPEIVTAEGELMLKNTTTELSKANAFAKVIDLRNANAAGIAYENRRRIIEAFSTPENPFDPGRSEVQAALLTYKIRNLWSHLTRFKRDLGNRRGLRQLVHQRAKILKYLKGLDQSRYEIALEQLALEPECVEEELVV